MLFQATRLAASQRQGTMPKKSTGTEHPNARIWEKKPEKE